MSPSIPQRKRHGLVFEPDCSTEYYPPQLNDTSDVEIISKLTKIEPFITITCCDENGQDQDFKSGPGVLKQRKGGKISKRMHPSLEISNLSFSRNKKIDLAF